MATILVGSKYLSEGASNKIEVYEDEKIEFQAEGFSHLYTDGSQLLKRFAADIVSVEVGFCDIVDLNFLQYLPHTESVWVLTSFVKDINGLRHAPQLRRLALERPTCRMDVLGELVNLEELHLDDWRPGADSIFNLTKLHTARIRRYPYPDLTRMSHWDKLRKLWLAYGGLESLDGIPDRITALELAELKKLRHIEQIGQCHELERLIIEACRRLASLAGIETCQSLKVLSVHHMGSLTDLKPIRNLINLAYLVLVEFDNLAERDDSVLDNLSHLQTLILSRRLGIPLERLRHVLPNTNIKLTK
jgi:hypothetical protein